ncbi:hypothetical protein POM88_041806 [Heracleum sosnowskyi]|uniref:Uncharacterized protein n=1 Tax=Heracleum sosnowskyi TaxID=360622 RepID=A0AAD8HEZ0_9APIA|nr:hypothetical protein POM88_041806 [Heracleum sosnowskyi]
MELLRKTSFLDLNCSGYVDADDDYEGGGGGGGGGAMAVLVIVTVWQCGAGHGDRKQCRKCVDSTVKGYYLSSLYSYTATGKTSFQKITSLLCTSLFPSNNLWNTIRASSYKGKHNAF